MTYSALQTEIAAKSFRSDLSSVIPTLIENAEAFMFRELSLVDLEDDVTETITSNVIPFPTGFMKVQKLEVSTPTGYVTLDYKNGTESETELTKYPLYYTIENAQIRILANVANGTAYRLSYTVKLSPLSVSNTTNWLLDNAKDLYVAASMVEVGRHCRNDALISMWQPLLPGLIESARSFSATKKYPIRGKLQIKPRR